MQPYAGAFLRKDDKWVEFFISILNFCSDSYDVWWIYY